MIHLLPLLCFLLGFAALALAMPRPQEQGWRRYLPARTARRLRMAGAAVLLLALWLLVWRLGWGLGLVACAGHASLAAGVVFCVLAAHARLRARLTGGSLTSRAARQTE